mmetsp:Transcript_45658/g.135175  ORF Transcript_45658/g.135175 Transcript_45658/m.135175 type:complete len:216 (+) Transcript_45658:419-1066(+)
MTRGENSGNFVPSFVRDATITAMKRGVKTTSPVCSALGPSTLCSSSAGLWSGGRAEPGSSCSGPAGSSCQPRPSPRVASDMPFPRSPPRGAAAAACDSASDLAAVPCRRLRHFKSAESSVRAGRTEMASYASISRASKKMPTSPLQSAHMAGLRSSPMIQQRWSTSSRPWTSRCMEIACTTSFRSDIRKLGHCWKMACSVSMIRECTDFRKKSTG